MTLKKRIPAFIFTNKRESQSNEEIQDKAGPTPWGGSRHQSFRLKYPTGLLDLSCPRRSGQGYSGKGLFLLQW